MLALALCLSAALAAPAASQSTYQWAQTNGGRLRSGVWPPSRIAGNLGAEGELASDTRSAELSAPLSPVLQPLGALPFPVYTVGFLEFEVPQVFKLEKVPPAVVTKSGTVVVATPAGTLYGLASPDAPGASWALAQWTQTTSDDEIDNSACYDVVLDGADNIYNIVTDRNLLKAFLYGFAAGGRTQLWPNASLQSNLRLTELYHISALFGGDGNIYVPTSSLLTNVGLAIVSAATGAVTPVMIDADLKGGATGSVWVGGASPPAAAFLISHGVSRKDTAMQAWAGASTPVWTSAATSFIADADQPNQAYDPYTKQIYWIGVRGTSATGDAPVMLYCVRGAGGAPCPGIAATGVVLKNAWGAGFYPVEWVYAGAIVPNAAGTAVTRLLFSFTTAGSFSADNPTGCVMALSPATGALLDSYCVPRDPDNIFGVDNFLATAPLVALDARGAGAHTALVGQFDCLLFAFDPLALAAGPLYVADPLPVADRASIASDHLSMTAAGTVIFEAWDDAQTPADWSVFAVPGILKLAPTNGAPPAAGLSTGAKAAITLTVLAAIGGAIGGLVYTGRAASLLAALGIGSAKYASVGAPSFSSAAGAAASPYSSFARK